MLPGTGQTQSVPVDADLQRLTIDLGRESTLHFRWPSGNAANASTAKMTVFEAYFWDLFSPGSECTAVLKYTVKGGSVARFSVAIPETVEPRDVEVAGKGAGGDNPSKPRLARWEIAENDGQQQVNVQLQEPATGEVLVTLHLVPRHLLGAGAASLVLPLPLGHVSSDGIVGYRCPAGFEAADKPSGMMTLVLTAEQFTRRWQSEAHGKLARPDACLQLSQPPARGRPGRHVNGPAPII